MTTRRMDARFILPRLCLPITIASLAVLGVNARAGETAMPSDNVYMGAPVVAGTLPNGARVNAVQINGSLGAHGARTSEVAPGIWAILGRSVVNSYVIEGKSGLLVYDTGTSANEGASILAEIRKVSAKPVLAILYSHSHYASGAGVIAEGKPVTVVGHPNVNGQVFSGGIGGAFFETLPIQFGRGAQQMGGLLPESGADAPAGERIDPVVPRAFVPVNHVAQDGEEMTIDGVRMQFFTRYASDSDSCLTVWLPDRKVVLNNFFWPVIANLYAPRGDEFRDARSWIGGLRQIRDLKPAILLSTHADPVVGAEQIQNALEIYIDGNAAVFDQTLRGILKGLGAEQLRYFVKLPARLKNSPYLTQTYGETVTWYPPSVYQRALGWYSGDAADLNPVSPRFEAEQLVALIGGVDRVLAAARKAEKKRQWAWALGLVNYVVKSDPENIEARKMKSSLLRRLASLTPSSIAHNFYMSQARALENKASLPLRVFPEALKTKLPPCALIDAYRVRIMPERTENLTGLLAFDLGEGNVCGLAIRPGIAEFIGNVSASGPPPTATIRLDRDTVFGLFRGDHGLADLIQDPHVVVSGDRAAAVALGAAFENLSPAESLPVPAQHHADF